MSRSRVNCGEPWATAAIPPITTKSTRPSVSAPKSAPIRSLGHSGNRGLRFVDPLAGVGVLGFVPLQPLARRQPQRLAEQGLIHARRPHLRVQHERAPQHVQRPLQRRDRDLVARCLEPRHGRLRDPEPARQLGLGQPLGEARFADEGAGGHASQTISSQTNQVTTRTRAYPHRSPMSDLENRTRYEPSEAEPRVFERWDASGRFHPEPAGTPEENYSIAIPPPNVTGALHMGHALNGSIQDGLIRHARMQGRNTKWILGTDHAGIATQTQVERLLRSQGTSREEIGREAFVERTWQWREQYGGTIIEQYKRLGASCDYDEERFTLDPAYAHAVQKVFVDLFAKGLIYRDNYMVNWDPGSRSAISDLEVEEREVTDTLYYVDYPLESGHGALTIATVRPETMLADTAIAVHPDDERYTRLIGETAILPIVGRRLRIIADPYVKPEFGTGALKITPGHDPNDFEIGRAHGLEEVTVIGED